MLLSVTLVIQLSVHRVILAEERMCVDEFGEDYKQYMQRVRRYI